MKKKLTMKNPCPKKWENMQGNDKVRLCESCDKNVEDFTDKSVEEIIQILESRKERTCARVFSSQLNPVKKIAAAVLIGGMLMGGSCSPKVSDSVSYINKMKAAKEGYVIIDDESILPLKLNGNGKVKIHIQGKVLGSDINEPLIGVTITIANTKRGTITDYDGTFNFEGEIESKNFSNYELVISYIGYKTLCIPLEKINMKKGLEIYLFQAEIKGIIIGELLLEEKRKFG